MMYQNNIAKDSLLSLLVLLTYKMLQSNFKESDKT
jgi:hypothetical protein